MKFLLEYLEIILSVAGLVVIAVATVVLGRMDFDAWHVAAITATAVGVLHGGIFWAVRRRQREVRRATLREAQAMLNEIINNYLFVIRGMSGLTKDQGVDRAVALIDESVERIAEVLKTIDEERLTAWKAGHPHRVRDGTVPENAKS